MARNDDEAFRKYRRVGERARRWFCRKGRIKAPFKDAGNQGVVGTRGEFDADLRITAVELGKHRRQPACRGAFQRAELEYAARRGAGYSLARLLRELDQPLGITSSNSPVAERWRRWRSR